MHDRSIKRKLPLQALSQWESVNFWATNRIPRVLATRVVGKLSQIQSPFLTKAMIGLWAQFSELDTDSTEEKNFTSLQAFFTRGLKPGKRPLPSHAPWVWPSDGLVGENGKIKGNQLLQIKGMPYKLEDLLQNQEQAHLLNNGHYLTIRLTSGMYHRFHAPCDLTITQVDYISGDVFNVNPPTLKRIPQLFCRNERAVITCQTKLTDSSIVTFYIVAVAAVLVASIRLHALPTKLSLTLGGATQFLCNYQARQGQELGWFEQGSTLLLLWPEGTLEMNSVDFGQRVLARQALK